LFNRESKFNDHARDEGAGLPGFTGAAEGGHYNGY
jgi:hypothetical protein